jgi:WD40 repeat protein
VSYSSDGHQVVSGSDDATVRIWDAHGGAELAVWPERSEVKSVEFSPDGRHVLVAINGKVRLRDAENGARIAVMRKCEFVSCVAYSPAL